jgi:hypothetical protein
MRPYIREDICKVCCPKLYIKCWRRKEKQPCKLYKRKIQEIKEIKYEEIKRKYEKKQFVELVDDSDILDSKGDDISDEEYVENEKFFALHE